MAGLSVWFQREITLKARQRGCHLITDEISKLEEVKRVQIGLCHILIKHTSASLSLNENWDPDVREDMVTALNRLVPDNSAFKHSCEGPDDMPAHVKSTLTGCDVTVPITDGRLNLGRWQGIWLCEHRNHGGGRELVVTIQGLSKSISSSPAASSTSKTTSSK